MTSFERSEFEEGKRCARRPHLLLLGSDETESTVIIPFDEFAVEVHLGSFIGRFSGRGPLFATMTAPAARRDVVNQVFLSLNATTRKSVEMQNLFMNETLPVVTKSC